MSFSPVSVRSYEEDAAAGFPVVESRRASYIGSANTFTFPTGSVEGDLVIIIVGNTGSAPTDPSGWTVVVQNDAGGAFCNIYAKVLTAADETAGTVDVVNANRQGATMYRISSHGGVAGVEGTSVDQLTTDTPNPPSLSPAAGSDNYLWIAGSVIEEGSRTVSSYPTNYTDGQFATGDTNSNTRPSIASAERELQGSSEDPGTLSWSAAAAHNDGVAFTVAVAPA